MVEGPLMAFLAVFALFAAILALVVFPTGFFTWTTGLIATGAGLVYFICQYLIPQGMRARTERRRTRDIEHACLAILAFLLLTLVPLPFAVTAHTGRIRHDQNARVAAAIDEANGLAALPASRLCFALTRNKAGTVRIALMVTAMFSTAMLAALLPRRRKITYVRFLTLIAGAIAAGGLLSRFRYPQGDTLWWIYPIPHGLPGPLACFTNPNHYGAFLAMLCPAQLGLVAEDFSARRVLRGLLGVGIFALTSLAILLSLSRGAFIAFAAGLCVSSILLVSRRRFLVPAGLVLCGAAAVAAFLPAAAPELKERLGTLRDITHTDSYTTRVSAWRDSLLIFRTYPIAGAGANAFRMVYPQHRRTSDGAVMTHPENEYVQLLTDSGLIGVTLFLVLCVCLRRDALLPALADTSESFLLVAGAGPALVAAVHSLMDFPLHIPVYSVTLASLTGLLLPFPSPRMQGVCLTPGVRVRLPLTAAINLAVALLLAALWGRFQRLDSPARLRSTDADSLRRALTWAPTSSHAWLRFGSAVRQAGRRPDADRFHERCAAQAAAYDPNNYRIWNTLGKLRQSLGDPRGAAEAFARVKELRDWFQVPFLPEDLE